MDRLLVTGGTGLLGTEIVKQLRSQNVETAILSRKSYPVAPVGLELFKGDLTTSEGLSTALKNARIIIHCASNPKEFNETDLIGTKNLINAILPGTINHLVYISIVGVEKSSYPYYKAKKEVEEMIAQSGIPYTIFRTTQFHHFVLNLINSILETKDELIKIPEGMSFQSVDSSEIAKRLIEIAFSKPAGLLPEFGGPDLLSFEEMYRQYEEILKMSTTWEALPLSGPRFELFRSGINLCPENAFGKITWETFLKNHFKLF